MLQVTFFITKTWLILASQPMNTTLLCHPCVCASPSQKFREVPSVSMKRLFTEKETVVSSDGKTKEIMHSQQSTQGDFLRTCQILLRFTECHICTKQSAGHHYLPFAQTLYRQLSCSAISTHPQLTHCDSNSDKGQRLAWKNCNENIGEDS